MKEKENKKIGLALSGGGSRAIAFHLGCFRALHKQGILNKLNVISSVSGGSVIAGMYAYSDEPFDIFEKQVINILKNGLQMRAFKEIIFSRLLFDIVATNLLFRPFNLIANDAWNKAFRRWRTRTDGLEKALDKFLFKNKFLHEVKRDLDVVINACELRTGTSFRFGNQVTGGWRFGKINSNSIKLAKAVTASAAYPVMLPALDCIFEFNKNNESHKKRVLLTDGGVYDNLGMTCMEPGRNSKYSYHVYSPDYIICCNAGYGMFSGDRIPNSFVPRVRQATATMMRKAQDATMGRLHQYRENKKIKGFILPYLGQIDSRLPFRITNLVKRDEVINYPTDFKAMKFENIELLSQRGEQLTEALLEYYLPNI